MNYDKLVARCHLKQVGVIIVDAECGQPIDNEYDLEEIYRIIKKQETEQNRGMLCTKLNNICGTPPIPHT